MAPRDYRMLCPNSGHVLPPAAYATRQALRPQTATCEACGRVVDVHPDPATGRSLLYSMHQRIGDTGRERNVKTPR